MSTQPIPAPPIAPRTPEEFRALAPLFNSLTMFPDESVEFWLGVAWAMLNRVRFANLFGTAVVLFVEHNMALEALAAAQGNAGGIPGIATGVISGQTALALSVSYDSGLAAEPDAGHWNLTTYGTRLIRMIRMFGAGPIQVGAGWGCAPGSWFNYGSVCGLPFGPGWWSGAAQNAGG